MRYFNYLSREEEQHIFHSAPVSFNRSSDKDLIAHAVGAALYMPATRATIADDIRSGKNVGMVSMVLDLEDAIGDLQVQAAEENMKMQLVQLQSYIQSGIMSEEDMPIIFIRVRSPEQMKRVIVELELEDTLARIAGFVLPKFSVSNCQPYLDIICNYNQKKSSRLPVLYVMPILESCDIIYRESRANTLFELKSVLHDVKDYVLNVRIGATDFSSLFGLRRSPDMTIYDIGVIRDCIADIVNVFGRADDNYVISGPVWEYFKSERVLKTQLRQTPFEEMAGRDGLKLRMQFINIYLDGLIREVAMDKENGIVGKTIIHPSHILPVQSLYAVTHEEFVDATHVLENNNGLQGVLKSQYSNKMNEIKPHLNWARRILIRSNIYGVLHENQNFTTLLISKDEQEQILV